MWARSQRSFALISLKTDWNSHLPVLHRSSNTHTLRWELQSSHESDPKAQHRQTHPNNLFLAESEATGNPEDRNT